jgi:peptidoglycan/LPS O-acetylase OafA/YrhL
MRRRADSTARVAYVDALRVLCLVGVFLVHLAEPFTPWDEWHVTNDVRSRAVGAVVVMLAPWLMPLFMLLAGFAAHHSLRRRPDGAYLRERVARLLVPLAVGTLLLVPPQVYAERWLRGEFHGSFVAFYPHFFEGLYPRGNFAVHHLWFLAHLAAYALVTLPLFRYWQHAAGRAQLRWVARVCAGPGGLVWLSLPLVLGRALVWGLFHDRHVLVSDWADHGLLLVAYVYGFILAAEPRLGRDVDVQWPRALGVGVASTTLLVAGAWLDYVPGRVPRPYAPAYVVFWTLYTVGAWSCMVAILGIARRWLRTARVPRAIGERAFAWYLVHQTVIVVAAAVIVARPLPVAAKVALLAVASVAGTVLVTEALRFVPLVRRAFALPAPWHAPAERADAYA